VSEPARIQSSVDRFHVCTASIFLVGNICVVCFSVYRYLCGKVCGGMVDSIYLSIADMFAQTVSMSWICNSCCRFSCPRFAEFEWCTSLVVEGIALCFHPLRVCTFVSSASENAPLVPFGDPSFEIAGRNNEEASSLLCITRSQVFVGVCGCVFVGLTFSCFTYTAPWSEQLFVHTKFNLATKSKLIR
jgi:hypothetical protein